MSIASFADWLDSTAPSLALKSNFWIVPSVQSVHIIAVCLVFSGAVICSLRAWSIVGVEWTPQFWARRLYPALWWSLLVLLITGSTLVLCEPPRELPNWSFQLKMACVLAATLCSLWLTRRFYGSGDAPVSLSVRILSSFTVLLWIVVICAGRWIAYV